MEIGHKLEGLTHRGPVNCVIPCNLEARGTSAGL